MPDRRDDLRMAGRRCLVTGAAGAIGLATARRLCEAGARVALGDLDREAIAAAADELRTAGYTAHTLPLDVTDEASVAGVVDEAARLLGGLDTLVANAGILTLGRVEDLPADAFRRTLDVNLVGTFLCVQAAVPRLRAAGGGAIVCVASHAGIEGVAAAGAYCASKFGVVGLTESLARELAADGIRANAVAPGMIDSPMLNDYLDRLAATEGISAERATARILEDVPIGRLGEPTEVAEAIVFLASDRASYISGATLPILGGETSR